MGSSSEPRSAAPRRWTSALVGLLFGACACAAARPAEPGVVARSFRPYRSATVGAEDLETFLRRRTALLISGPASIEVVAADGRLDDRTTFESDEAWYASGNAEAALGAAAAISADGYFLTAAHVLAAGPAHVVIEVDGGVRWARAREVWFDGARDVALVHAELQPAAWFELLPDRALAAGEIVVAFGHWGGPAAGRIEVPVDLAALGEYGTIEIPHDTPLRRGHSGGPAAMLDGRLVGVQTSTGMDTIFRRRSWCVRVRPAELEERIERDRRGTLREETSRGEKVQQSAAATAARRKQSRTNISRPQRPRASGCPSFLPGARRREKNCETGG